MILTILTPSYNRGDNLFDLYKSLINQTNQSFEWLIVDDGSTDNTQDVINKFISQNRIKIRYIKKQNGGKHTALNVGIQNICSDLTFIVDSDDWLTENAVEEIISVHNENKDNTELCGYCFLKKQTNGTISGKTYDKPFIDTYINARINKRDMLADKAEVWKTSVLKNYPFVEYEGEKFLGEDSVWIPIALKYKLLFINSAIYIYEYLDDGLTNNRRWYNIKSPNGCFYRAKVTLEASKKTKIETIFFAKCMLQFQIYGRFAHKSFSEMMSECPYKLLHIIFYPISFLFYKKWKRDFEKQ